MDLRLVALALVFPSTILLPVCVYDVHRAFDEPDSFEFWIGVVGHFSTIVLLDCGLRFAGELWDEEMRKRPPDKPLPQPDPLPLLQGAVLVLVQLLGLGTYATTMDGGVAAGSPERRAHPRRMAFERGPWSGRGSCMNLIAGSVACLLAWSLLAPAATAAEPPPRKHTNLERLAPERLAAVHADVETL